MARYFFNIFDGQDVFDEVGSELSTAGEIRKHMLKRALEFVLENEHRQMFSWQMEAVKEGGSVVSTMDFGVKKDEAERSE